MPGRVSPLKPFLLRLAVAVSLAAFLSATALAGQAGGPLQKDARLVTAEQIMASLPKTPIAVGFDVDDTLLFSSPGFYYGAMNDQGPGGKNKYGPDFIESKAFWEDMNSRFDQFSIPKRVVGGLLRRHAARGDRVYIITARPLSPGEKLTGLLERVFKVKLAKPALFTGNPDKSKAIKKLGISLYYGDSDSDISSAIKVKARPIRVLRAVNSLEPDQPHPGGQGEEILAGSQR